MGKYLTILFLGLIAWMYFYTHSAPFGKLPQKERLERIKKSQNYRSGSFQNQHFTILISQDKENSYTWASLLFPDEERLEPSSPLPVLETDLRHLDPEENILVWFGHSSYFIQLEGKKILIDPLFSEISSPIPFFPKSFEMQHKYEVQHIPDLDYLIITHDHWDHLDYETVIQMKHRIKKVICPLGVGETLEYWGFDKEKITEMDWDDYTSDDKIYIYCQPARHFSGRTLTHNKTLWASYVIRADEYRIFISGDTGYDDHFKEIEKKFGPMDLAILDSGQHHEDWKYIHMMIPEVVNAAKDLKAKVLIPSHICKLRLAHHAWDAPMEELKDLSIDESYSLVVPVIGEKVDLKFKNPKLNMWWRSVR